MINYKKIKAILFILNQSRLDKQSFNKRMKRWLTWHKPFEPSNEIDGTSYCPSCGSLDIKDNDEGFFRCKNEKCEKQFIILKRDEK